MHTHTHTHGEQSISTGRGHMSGIKQSLLLWWMDKWNHLPVYWFSDWLLTNRLNDWHTCISSSPARLSDFSTLSQHQAHSFRFIHSQRSTANPTGLYKIQFQFFFFRCRDLLIKVEELRGVLRRLDFGGQMVEAKQGLWFNLRENEIWGWDGQREEREII